MRRFLRWLRGAIGNALTWGVVWFGFGTVLGVIAGVRWGVPGLETLLFTSSVFGAAGVVFGGAFSAFLSANFRGQRVDELSPGRFAFGGALVTVPFTLLLRAWAQYSLSGWVFFGDLIMPVAMMASLGGLTAYGTVKLAQRALPAGSDIGELPLDRSARLGP